MVHTGTVREVNDSLALVAVDPTRCGRCPGRGACMGLSRGVERLLEAVNEAEARVGDTVEVELKPGTAMRAVLLVFVLPVLLMGAGYLSVRGDPLTGALGATAGLSAGLALSWFASSRLRTRPGCGMTVKRVLETGDKKL